MFRVERFINVILLAVTVFSVIACSDDAETGKRLSKQEKERLRVEDSLALKIGVLPTLDCLPLYVAKENDAFNSLGADVRLKGYRSQIDCDAALADGKIEGNVTDLVRAERMKRKGADLRYVTATNAYWQIISNRKARVKNLKQMKDKMVAMTRLSVTDMLSDMATDSSGVETEFVFRVQINDVNLRLKMLMNNEMDAVILPEPQATTARLYKNHVLMDSRKKDMTMGVVALRGDAMDDKRRQKQLELFIKAYNQAVDSINKHGIKQYADIIMKYMKADRKTVAALPAIKFGHVAEPREKDIETAGKWLRKK